MCYLFHLKFLSFCDFLKKGVTRAVKKFPEDATLFGLVKVVGYEDRLNKRVTRHYFCRQSSLRRM